MIWENAFGWECAWTWEKISQEELSPLPPDEAMPKRGAGPRGTQTLVENVCTRAKIPGFVKEADSCVATPGGGEQLDVPVDGGAAAGDG